MHAVLRHYLGDNAHVLDAIVPGRAEVERVLRSVPGFIAYFVVRNVEGGATVTICATQAGTQESTRRAAAWVQENVPDAVSTPPTVSDGEVVLHFTI